MIDQNILDAIFSSLARIEESLDRALEKASEHDSRLGVIERRRLNGSSEVVHHGK